jgi:hypothetical protein
LDVALSIQPYPILAPLATSAGKQFEEQIPEDIALRIFQRNFSTKDGHGRGWEHMG